MPGRSSPALGGFLHFDASAVAIQDTCSDLSPPGRPTVRGLLLWRQETAGRIAVSPLEIAAPKMTIVFHMADDGFNGGSAS